MCITNTGSGNSSPYGIIGGSRSLSLHYSLGWGQGTELNRMNPKESDKLHGCILKLLRAWLPECLDGMHAQDVPQTHLHAHQISAPVLSTRQLSPTASTTPTLLPFCSPFRRPYSFKIKLFIQSMIESYYRVRHFLAIYKTAKCEIIPLVTKHYFVLDTQLVYRAAQVGVIPLFSTSTKLVITTEDCFDISNMLNTYHVFVSLSFSLVRELACRT
jgi:hypothetical protein